MFGNILWFGAAFNTNFKGAGFDAFAQILSL